MSELEISVLIMRENMLFSGEICTATKDFALPPVWSVVKNLTSGQGGASQAPQLTCVPEQVGWGT